MSNINLASVFGYDWERISRICKEIRDYWLNPVKGLYNPPRPSVKELKRLAKENGTSVTNEFIRSRDEFLNAHPSEAIKFYTTRANREKTIQNLHEELARLVNAHGANVFWDGNNTAACCGDRFTFTINGEVVCYTF